jgi:hypothetical protein
MTPNIDDDFEFLRENFQLIIRDYQPEPDTIPPPEDAPQLATDPDQE